MESAKDNRWKEATPCHTLTIMAFVSMTRPKAQAHLSLNALGCEGQHVDGSATKPFQQGIEKSRTSKVINMDVIFREAQDADIKNIAALGTLVWLHTYTTNGIKEPFWDYVCEEFSAERVAATIAKETVVVAILDEHLVGYGVLKLNSHCPDHALYRAEIDHLYIHPSLTSKGFGQSICCKLFESSIAHGFTKVWLTVFHENERALAFYRKNGWMELGHTFFCLYEERHKNIIMGIDLEQ